MPVPGSNEELWRLTKQAQSDSLFSKVIVLISEPLALFLLLVIHVETRLSSEEDIVHWSFVEKMTVLARMRLVRAVRLTIRLRADTMPVLNNSNLD